MLLHAISIVDMLDDKQNAQHQNGKTGAKGTTADTPMEQFCLAMDNYCTVPKKGMTTKSFTKYHATRGKVQ
eukprot:3496742-Ditylum_brightwellii.AAC.1